MMWKIIPVHLHKTLHSKNCQERLSCYSFTYDSDNILIQEILKKEKTKQNRKFYPIQENTLFLLSFVSTQMSVPYDF